MAQGLNPCFMRLAQKMKHNPNGSRSITVMLGAGCSLTSSEKDITTQGILEALLREYTFSEEVPSSWPELYKDFVNNVWANQGEQDHIQLLQPFFTDMVPSLGYQVLRWLVENNYVNQILTTNFDLMLDKALEGLSYRLIVGTQTMIIGNDPTFTVVKAHGDMRYGELRFAPAELTRLPRELSEEIHRLTAGVVLVVGYRGQDVGLLNALEHSGDYAAYWAAPEVPDQLNAYENEQIFTWMRARHSEGNFLSGSQYGRFDQLMMSLKSTIQELEQRDLANHTSRFHDIWKNSIFYDYFCLNKRFLSIFERLHQFLEQSVQGDTWQVAKPYFAPSCESFMSKALEQARPIIPDNYTSCVANEVDALLFCSAFSIQAICQGYPHTSRELVKALRDKYEQANCATMIGEEFWVALEQLSESSLIRKNTSLKISLPLCFSFDKNGNLQTILQHVELDHMHRLMCMIYMLMLFLPTCADHGEPLTIFQIKKEVETHLYKTQPHGENIHLYMDKISVEKYQMIRTQLQKLGFIETKLQSEYILYQDAIHVFFPVEEALPPFRGNLWDDLFYRAQESRALFLAGLHGKKLIDRPAAHILYDFLTAPSNALFLVGDSGTGKTTILQQWVQKLDPSQYLVYPLTGRDWDNNSIHEDIGIWPDDNIMYLDISLQQRGQIMVIIIDAINEIRQSFSGIVSFYTSLLHFCDHLSQKKCSQIKIIISCRYDYYCQLKRSSGIEPESRAFYLPVTKDEPQCIWKLPVMTHEELISFTRLYKQLGKEIDAQELYEQFGDMIYQPIYLQLICEAHIGGKILPHSAVWTDLYSVWFQSLIRLAATDGIQEQTIYAVIFKVIYCRFFTDSANDQIYTHQLAAELRSEYPNALAVFEWLTVQKLFHKNASQPNLVQFSHDRIEEYFLCRYILTHYKNQMGSIDLHLRGKALLDPIVQSALSISLCTLYRHNLLLFTSSLAESIAEGRDGLLNVWISALFHLIREDKDSTANFFREFEKYITKKEYAYFLRAMLLQIQQRLDDMEDVGICITDTIGAAVKESNAGDIPALKVLAHNLMAQQRFLFPDEDDNMVFDFALSLCNQAEDWLSDDVPDSITDHIHTLKALLLQNQGKINEAIELMHFSYQRQLKYAVYDTACQSALYLGAMYREMTQYDNAISLYQSIDGGLISNGKLRNRLLMNTGIIYKNMIQNSLFLGEGATEQNLEYYRCAHENFDKVRSYAEEQDDVKLKLEIYAEHVELACVAYYLDLGTIQDAVNWVEKMDVDLPRYHTPVMRIQCHRMRARVLVLERKFDETIDELERGFAVATDYHIPFRAADCANQITGTLCDALSIRSFATEEMLNKGLSYGQYAIDYYRQLNKSDHRYLQDAQQKYQRILAAKQAHRSEP